ncbi:disheveled-associated activator of morphogenesis 1-like isoform X2 [Eriocheir sinensis]|uniref:disheveled-associated activator of morphogenesis 1-like isoform X2 n=1 Tax=Eriocheir sinensis TaxID=95602 RepID=UPI0021C81152|nr:disheveled-associated activator of morphogenesis 1-like isoform X2 [Eriocheir sinensis]
MALHALSGLRDTMAQAVGGCVRGSEDKGGGGPPPDAPPNPPSWAGVKEGLQHLPWPAWGTIKESLRPDWEWTQNPPWKDLRRPDLKTPSLEEIRSSFSDLSVSLHERVSSWGERVTSSVEWPREARSRSHSRSRIMKRGAKMRRGDWYSSCFCFKGSEPPQIEHVVSEQPQMVQVAPPPNMTDDLQPEELQTKVTELLDELDLTTVQKNGILNFPPEKQLQLLYDYHTLKSSNKVERVESYIAKLEEYAQLKAPTDQYQEHTWVKYTEGLKTALGTQSNTFVNEFMEAGGLAALLNLLTEMDDSTFQTSIHMNVIACVKALMNNSNGRKHILAHPTCMNIISQSLATHHLKTKTLLLEILGGVCLLPGGHKKVLEAMLHFQKHAGERTRFQTLIVDLDRSFGNFVDELALKIAAMSFINAIIRWGPGEDSLEFRLHLRYEFLMLGVQPVIEKLRALQNEILDTHLDAFEFYRAEDEREWARRYEEVHVDTKSASSMFKLLQGKLQYSAAYPHFLSLLHHLLLMSNDMSAPDHWILFDRVLQQLVTQDEDGRDREVALLDINVNSIVKLIANERELTESRRKIAKLEADFADVVTDLNKKEQELFTATQEKEEVSQTLQQVRGQLEAEVRACGEAQRRAAEQEAAAASLTQQLRDLAAGSLSDDVKASIAKTKDASGPPKGAPCPPPPPPPMMNGAPPPPPPMMNGIAPPPPPPMRGGPPPPPLTNGGPPPPPIGGGRNKPAKQVPKSANQLRAFNWAKMPDSRITNTIFASLDESPLYKFMDLEDIDRTFDASAGKRANGEGEKTLERMKSQRSQQISVLENRRQQNCTILLSKLKMTNDELIRVLLKMDSDGELAPDMVEQLLKFTPTAEEKVMLEEHLDEIEHLARADRFLYEISKIDHYEERLRCLHYQKKFRERLGECDPKMQAVLSATKELKGSKRLKKFIEVILAFGNYMNKGARGGAYGFRMSSLNKLTDTKSAHNRNITLLHYILRVCEKQWRDNLRLDEDFPNLKEAAKVNITELEREMSGLSQGLEFIEREVTWHRGQGSPPPGDRFRLAMNEFSALAKDKFANLESLFTLMKREFEGVTALFGEDPKTTQPEDFFGTFDSFIDTFREAKRDLENMRKKEEEEERKKKEMERYKRRSLPGSWFERDVFALCQH